MSNMEVAGGIQFSFTFFDWVRSVLMNTQGTFLVFHTHEVQKYIRCRVSSWKSPRRKPMGAGKKIMSEWVREFELVLNIAQWLNFVGVLKFRVFVAELAISGSRLLEMLIVCRMVKKFFSVFVVWISLPYWEERTAWLYPEPAEFL